MFTVPPLAVLSSLFVFVNDVITNTANYITTAATTPRTPVIMAIGDSPSEMMFIFYRKSVLTYFPIAICIL